MTSFVETKLEGYVKKDFQKEGAIYDVVDFGHEGGIDPAELAKVDDYKDQPLDAKIYNARELQAAFQGSKAEFFNEHGFVLLDSETKVTEWNSDYAVFDS